MEQPVNIHSPCGLEQHGIQNVNAVYWNLSIIPRAFARSRAISPNVQTKERLYEHVCAFE